MVDFFKPNTLQDAKALIDKLDNPKILAGGTDLILKLQKNNKFIDNIIDIGNINLNTIEENDRYVILGSMVTFEMLKESDMIKSNFNGLYKCSKTMGSPQIRNRATIGGNIINAAPAADSIPCLMSLNSAIVLESYTSMRTVSLDSYFKNYTLEKIKDNEILTKIIIPKSKGKSSYYKLGKRNALSISRLSVAVNVNYSNDIINNFNISLGAVARYPFRIYELEKKSIKKNISWLLEEEALKLLEDAVYYSINGRATMPFKREAIKGCYKIAIEDVLN